MDWTKPKGMGISMNEEASGKVREISQRFIDFLQDKKLSWSKAFFRFYADERESEATCSYIQGAESKQLSAADEPEFHQDMMRLFSELRDLMFDEEVRFFLALLVVDDNLNYDIYFEHIDASRWAVSKLGDDTGVRAGYGG